MAKAYSIDLRKRVAEAYEQGEGSMRELAKRFRVSLNFVKRLRHRYQEEQTLEPKKHGGGNPQRVKGEVEEGFLRSLLKEKNDRTLEEFVREFEQQFKKTMSVSTMHETLKRMNWTHKKKVFMIPNARVRPSQNEP